MNESERDLREVRDKLSEHERAIAENKHGLVNARQILDVQLKQLGTDIAELKSALKWAGGLVISLMISFMGWAALQQFNANEEQKRNLQDQVELLRQQEAAKQERGEILRNLRASGADVEETNSDTR